MEDYSTITQRALIDSLVNFVSRWKLFWHIPLPLFLPLAGALTKYWKLIIPELASQFLMTLLKFHL